MSDQTQINLCILWESELRTAARLLQAALAKPEPNLPTLTAHEENRAALYRDAMIAAYTALAHLTDDRAVVIISPPLPEKTTP